MTQIPPERRGGRRTQRREQDAYDGAERAKRKKKVSMLNLLAALVLLAVAALMVLVSPKSPVMHAYYTIGTPNNQVAEGQALTVGEYEGLVISELMSSNKSAVPDENGEYHDWIELWNSTDHDIRLYEVGLSDKSDSIRFLFPDVVLPADGRVIVYCSNTNRAEIGQNFHAKFKLSSVGETVYLFDRNAYLIDSVKLPIMSSDESWALQEDGTFVATKNFSPGFPNTDEGYLSYRSATTVVDGALVINEIMPDPLTGYRDADGDLCDWIELYNTTDKPVSLDNYALSNREDKPLKWRFPQGAVVAPYGYYIVFCSGKDIRDDASSVPHANFKISAENDTIVLSDSRGRMVDRVSIDNIPKDCSWARNSNGTYSIHNVATPGYANDQNGANAMDYALRSLNELGVYITEVMSSNSETVTPVASAGFTDWVELYNATDHVVDLSGCGLSDNIGRARKWQFTQGTYINPGEYKIVYLDGDVSKDTGTAPHASFRLSRAGGEVLCLSDPSGRIYDKVVLPEIPTNVSYGRTTGLAGFFYYDTPTPGAQNGTGFLGYVSAPSLLVEPGLHYQAVSAGFSLPEKATVFYTTDGSIPTRESGILYTGQPIELNFTTVLRAKAFSDDPMFYDSDVVTGTYFINAYHTLPVVSVTVDPWELWNPETGMLVYGDNVDKSGGPRFKNTIYREFGKIDRPAYIEYYGLDGTTILNQGTEIALKGDFSLDLPQKSFKFHAKAVYGSPVFSAKLFDDRDFTEYKCFALRNGGNDGAWTRLLDGFQSRMLDYYGTSVIHQAWQPVAVYLNGVYWGHFNMREQPDRFSVAQYEGLTWDEADDMVIIEAGGAQYYGDRSGYRSMISRIKESDPANDPAALQYILDNVDVDNYFEYIALEMFVGNSDIANMRAYRLNREGSKWKWVFYDADYGMYQSDFNSPWSYTKKTGMGQKNVDNTILLKLLSVPEYKDKFLRKLGDIFKTFTTETMLAILEPMVEQIEPEMSLHFARWAEEHDRNVVMEWPTNADSAYRYWVSRVERLRNTIKKRPSLLWGFVQEAFELTDEQMLEYLGPQPVMPPDAV
ncbi:MAG: lamin tail domain-containing protein [Christensenellaceae bacterium]|nr:lamin tail domain-containing protein [Christensenellaceae bacterium]